MKDTEIEFINRVIKELSYSNVTGEVALFIACQFALESTFGLSKFAMQYNNYCGMKVPFVRPSLCINYRSHDDVFACYRSFEACVIDYMYCLIYHRPMAIDFDSVYHFKHFIKGWYCPENSYLDKIDSLYVQFKNLLK